MIKIEMCNKILRQKKREGKVSVWLFFEMNNFVRSSVCGEKLNDNVDIATSVDGTTTQYSFSNGVLPSLGARSNRRNALRKFIISPFDPRYRLIFFDLVFLLWFDQICVLCYRIVGWEFGRIRVESMAWKEVILSIYSIMYFGTVHLLIWRF